MKVLLVAGVILILGTVSYGTAAPRGPRCTFGRALAFAAIRRDPPYLVGDIPNHFTSDSRYFSRRYDCRGESVEVRRVDLGVYDVRFTGVTSSVVQVTALSDEGVTASAFPRDGFIRVALRGPISGNNVATRRDVAFSLVVF